MKILYTNFHKHYKGGHATYILNLYEALHKRHSIHIADPATSGLHQEAKKMDPTIAFAQDYPKRLSELLSMFSSVKQLRKLIKKNRYDIIHVNGSPDLQITLLSCFGLKHRPKIIYTKHNSIPISKNIFSVFKFKATKAIIVVCGCQKAWFEAIGIPSSHIRVIKNGLDTDHFAPVSVAERQAMRAKLGFKDSDFVLVSSAGTAPYKRWEQMVEAVSKLKNSHIKIVFIGGAPNAQEQAKLVDALGMTDRVSFVGLITDTRPYVAVGDLGFVLSDSIETVSFACREMMSMGQAMIVSDYACLPENITPGENGWIVKAGDVTAIQKAVEYAYAHKDKLPAMGQKSREQALREFSIVDFARQTERVYEQALS